MNLGEQVSAIAEICTLRAQVEEARREREAAVKERDNYRDAWEERAMNAGVVVGARDAALSDAARLREALRECSQGQDDDGVSCWCTLPSMIPYRGHDTGCEAARAALAGKETP